jgi:hypothetical protein
MHILLLFIVRGSPLCLGRYSGTLGISPFWTQPGRNSTISSPQAECTWSRPLNGIRCLGSSGKTPSVGSYSAIQLCWCEPGILCNVLLQPDRFYLDNLLHPGCEFLVRKGGVRGERKGLLRHHGHPRPLPFFRRLVLRGLRSMIRICIKSPRLRRCNNLTMRLVTGV